jgi:hypothetical protein
MTISHYKINKIYALDDQGFTRPEISKKTHTARQTVDKYLDKKYPLKSPKTVSKSNENERLPITPTPQIIDNGYYAQRSINNNNINYQSDLYLDEQEKQKEQKFSKYERDIKSHLKSVQENQKILNQINEIGYLINENKKQERKKQQINELQQETTEVSQSTQHLNKQMDHYYESIKKNNDEYKNKEDETNNLQEVKKLRKTKQNKCPIFKACQPTNSVGINNSEKPCSEKSNVNNIEEIETDEEINNTYDSDPTPIICGLIQLSCKISKFPLTTDCDFNENPQEYVKKFGEYLKKQ